jgi:hypothetical protein
MLGAAVALASCGGAPDPCHEPLDDGLVRIRGYVVVEPGEGCPPAEDAGPLETGGCCFVYQGENCGFVERVTETSSSWATTWGGSGADSTREVCIYEGIFEQGAGW